MQQGIVFAGEFEKKAKKTVQLGEKLDKLKSKAEGFEGKDFTDFETVQKAEATIADIGRTSEKLETSLEDTVDAFGKVIGKEIALEHKVPEEKLELEEEKDEGPPKEEDEEKKELPEPIKLFLPIMHFVDQPMSEMPSTCGGDLLGNPIVGTENDCALSCEKEGLKCSGFSFFFSEKTSICFLFKKMKSVTYYTECGEKKFIQVDSTPRSFLQLSSPSKSNRTTNTTNATKAVIATNATKIAKSAPRGPSPFALALRKKRSELKQKIKQRLLMNAKIKGIAFKKAPEDTMCYAKSSMHVGTSLAPDPSGKCKLCLKTADKAQRCFG
jgi:hypothetical protein